MRKAKERGKRKIDVEAQYMVFEGGGYAYILFGSQRNNFAQ
jgi:hypothetical protein